MTDVGMAIAFAPLTRREIPEARRTRRTISTANIRPTETRARVHIAQVVQCTHIVTVALRTSIGREMISTRNTQMTLRAHHVGFARALTADWVALGADRTRWITITG
jgi:hypothetical protein